MARQPQRRNRPSRPPAPPRRASWSTAKLASIGGLALAVGAIALGLTWSFSPKSAPDHPAEARAFLKSGMAGRAERALRASIVAEPADPEPYRLLLEVFRVEDRSFEVDRLAWEAIARLKAVDRPAILRELTLALLTDLPDDIARTALTRWSAADPADVEARVALLRRIAAMPRSSDPDRPSRLAELSTLAAEHPESLNAREALVSEQADAGEPDRGRELLDAWAASADVLDARYWRLRGRWDLEYDHQPGRAVEAFRKALAEQPADWRTRYRLARALRQDGRIEAANAEAEAVRRTREVLDPLTLGPRLESALGRLDEPSARLELSEVCNRAGLARLAEAWKGLSDR